MRVRGMTSPPSSTTRPSAYRGVLSGRRQQLWTELFPQAEAAGFPPFLTEVKASSPLNASPYVTSLEDLRAGRALPARREQVRRLVDYLTMLAAHGVQCDFMVLGGSLLDASRTPRDIDALFLYRARDGFDTAGLRDLQIAAEKFRIDARLAPIDGDMLPALKITLFMAMLYSTDRSGSLARGVVLVDCRGGGDD